MINKIKDWATELLSEAKSINMKLGDIESKQRQMQSEIRHIGFDVGKLSNCIDDGWSNKPKSAILTKHHKEGTI